MRLASPNPPNNIAKRAILRFVTQLLRPVVHILLSYGFSCSELQEACRWLYVDEARKRKKFWGGEKPFNSRIATITGLSRKAVLHYSNHPSPDDLVAEIPGNRASRVQGGWLKDPRYLEDDGTPKAILFFSENEPCFVSLVRQYSGDVTPRAVLAELERAGAIETDRNRVRLVQRAYLPADEDELLDIAGMSGKDLLTTLQHNLDPDARNRYLQRELYLSFIPVERAPELRERLVRRVNPLLEDLHQDILYCGDQEPQPHKKYTRAGIGLYYFQDD